LAVGVLQNMTLCSKLFRIWGC